MKSSKKKVYLFLFLTIIVLVGIWFFFLKEKSQLQTLVETKERASGSYAIAEDMVILNVLPDDNQVSAMVKEPKLKLIGYGFEDGGNIPSKYTCDGDNINPSFEISGVSEKAKSLVLIMDDPDAPVGVWDHWIKFNIPVSTTQILEGVEPEGIAGKGTGGGLKYSGPCPPDKEHQYIFKLYALDIELVLPEGSSKAEVEKAMTGHVLQETQLVGNYKRIIKVE
ncbi:MAG: YbhB/YbcL family Raf kinase inhibitor-like protein [Patescibacteria group bacterium]